MISFSFLDSILHFTPMVIFMLEYSTSFKNDRNVGIYLVIYAYIFIVTLLEKPSNLLSQNYSSVHESTSKFIVKTLFRKMTVAVYCTIFAASILNQIIIEIGEFYEAFEEFGYIWKYSIYAIYGLTFLLFVYPQEKITLESLKYFKYIFLFAIPIFFCAIKVEEWRNSLQNNGAISFEGSRLPFMEVSENYNNMHIIGSVITFLNYPLLFQDFLKLDETFSSSRFFAGAISMFLYMNLLNSMQKTKLTIIDKNMSYPNLTLLQLEMIMKIIRTIYLLLPLLYYLRTQLFYATKIFKDIFIIKIDEDSNENEIYNQDNNEDTLLNSVGKKEWLFVSIFSVFILILNATYFDDIGSAVDLIGSFSTVLLIIRVNIDEMNALACVSYIELIGYSLVYHLILLTSV